MHANYTPSILIAVTKKICLLMMCCGCYSGRYYYWNTETDEVSWLSPQHPRAVITLSAERLKGFAQSFADECLVSI